MMGLEPTCIQDQNGEGSLTSTAPRRRFFTMLTCQVPGVHHAELNRISRYHCFSVGQSYINQMLPDLTKLVGKSHATNHCLRFGEFKIWLICICTCIFRSTAIMYMRRARLPWETIAKITGHKSTKNLIAYYDTYLEGQGMQVFKNNCWSKYYLRLCWRLYSNWHWCRLHSGRPSSQSGIGEPRWPAEAYWMGRGVCSSGH